LSDKNDLLIPEYDNILVCHRSKQYYIFCCRDAR